eukprot:scaffold278111_cov15-Tisochrysis_lutea.AAC.1
MADRPCFHYFMLLLGIRKCFCKIKHARYGRGEEGMFALALVRLQRSLENLRSAQPCCVKKRGVLALQEIKQTK